MVSKCPKDRVVNLWTLQMAVSWPINGGDPNYLLTGMALQVKGGSFTDSDVYQMYKWQKLGCAEREWAIEKWKTIFPTRQPVVRTNQKRNIESWAHLGIFGWYKGLRKSSRREYRKLL